MSKVLVEKNFEMMDGEELQDAVQKVTQAVSEARSRMAMNAHLMGIYKGYVILRDFEQRKFFKMSMKREGDKVMLSDMQEVRQMFVPVKSKMKKDASATLVALEGQVLESSMPSDQISDILKSAEGEHSFEEVEVKKNLWSGVL